MEDYYYKKNFELKGNPAKALEMLLNIFIQSNFRIIKKEAFSFELEGPGMNSTRQNPLVGISEAKVVFEDNILLVQVVMGGVAKMRRFMIRLISGMAVFFAVLFGISFATVGAFAGINPSHAVLVAAPLLIWVFLIPVLTRVMKHRTIKALNIAAENAVNFH
jgi:hypothetical protein